MQSPNPSRYRGKGMVEDGVYVARLVIEELCLCKHVESEQTEYGAGNCEQEE